jgi:hypothetical protein
MSRYAISARVDGLGGGGWRRRRHLVGVREADEAETNYSLCVEKKCVGIAQAV